MPRKIGNFRPLVLIINIYYCSVEPIPLPDDGDEQRLSGPCKPVFPQSFNRLSLSTWSLLWHHRLYDIVYFDHHFESQFMRLKDKVAIVTGGASGFGEGIVTRFLAEGAFVVIADINLNAAIKVANNASCDPECVSAVEVDVADKAAVENMVKHATDTFGRLDILVNNAGIAQRRGPMLDVDEDTFDRIYAVNVKSIYLSALAAVPILQAGGGGVIINTASTAAVSPRPGLTWYNGSKGAVVTLTKSMAVELAPDNIRVNAINPVIGQTGLTADFMGGEDTPEIREKFLSTIPLGRMSTPEDIAAAALYFASDEASFITGVCLEVDGGRCI